MSAWSTPCRGCGNASPYVHVYGERKCCPDCDHRAEPSVRDRAAEVLVAHQRHKGGCLCGWNGLGRSLPDHQADALAAAGLLRTDTLINNLPKEGTP